MSRISAGSAARDFPASRLSSVPMSAYLLSA
jgi:hypothetical protein